MARYTQDSIERLRESADIVALISRKTDLRRVGSRWTGLCPFHDERTPSFSVDAERGLYHCFGCGQGGDAIGFVMETESLDFPTAVEQLAEDAHVELKREREDPQEEERRRRRERLLALLERTTAFYAATLRDSPEARRARDYLRDRGLSDDVLSGFRVGYAPKAWDRLLTAARRQGFTEGELLGAGLATRGRNGGIYDRFRERITFPLADARGRVLGFGARAMRDEQGAKYINTAEGETYHKGRQLFGIDLARAAVAKAGRVIVVEGYTDVLALHQAQITESVGIMGTAFTQEQMAELARVVGADGTVYLALDADRSGQEAMLRAARMAADRSVALRVVQLPEGKDPADLVTELGAQAVTALIQGALSVLEFEVGRVLADGDLDSPEGRDRALSATRELIGAAAPRSVSRKNLVLLVADRLDVPVDYVDARSEGRLTAAPPASGSSPARAGGGPDLSKPEITYLALSLAAGTRGREELERLDDEHLTSNLVRRVRDHLIAHFDDPLAGLPGDDAEVAAMVSGIALRAEDMRPLEPMALRRSFLNLDLRRIERQMRHARHDDDRERLGKLSGEHQRVKQAMGEAIGSAS
ncbi:MAG: DNA primase [Thermoleophilaceae bacterium]